MGIARGVGRAVKALRRKSSNRLMGNRNKQGDLLTVDQQIEDLQRDVKMLEEDYFDYAQDKGFDVDTPSVENPDEFWSQGEGFQVISDIEELMQKGTDQDILKIKSEIISNEVSLSGVSADDSIFLKKIEELEEELEDLNFSKLHHKKMLKANNYKYFKDAWTTAEQRKKGQVGISKEARKEIQTERAKYDDIPF